MSQSHIYAWTGERGGGGIGSSGVVGGTCERSRERLVRVPQELPGDAAGEDSGGDGGASGCDAQEGPCGECQTPGALTPSSEVSASTPAVAAS